ncbi:hypothetical protein NGC32_08515 [Kluyvera cryocrescens]|uniref:hypothetical protein n=1 Tax=Kluyvera cryocrescens TaxID=580 RepID=UPI002DBD42A4|nr:hypothetical protein [Kluyvera cryocrescens]MEB7712771.1 hypothetical protein [Kluyvera cryocrescens]
MSKSAIKSNTGSMMTEMKTKAIGILNEQPTDEELTKISSLSCYFKSYFFQYSLAAIIIGFAIQPLIIFSDPIALASTGVILAYAVFTAYRLLVVSSVSRLINRRWLAIEMIIVLIILGVSLFYTGSETFKASYKHDLYCRDIQYLIKHAKDSEKNSNIFNNMKCRFQSMDS